MTAQIAAYGRLVDDPQVKQTSKGTPMTLARMAVSLPCSQAQDGQATLWLMPVPELPTTSHRYWLIT